MKKAIFILLVALTFQGSAQVKEGYYLSTETSFTDFDENGVVSDSQTYIDTTYLYINDHGFRVMNYIEDWGVFFPWCFIKQDEKKNYLYTVYKQDACKINIKKNFFLFYHSFNDTTGFYNKGTMYMKLNYLHE